MQKSFIDQIIQREISLDDLSDEDLAQFCQTANLAYRAGEPIVTDKDYDFIYLAALKERLHNNLI
jgi:DNA ligase (NAD+)